MRTLRKPGEKRDKKKAAAPPQQKRIKPWDIRPEPAAVAEAGPQPKRTPKNMENRPGCHYDGSRGGRETRTMREVKRFGAPMLPKLALGEIDKRHEGELIFVLGSAPSLTVIEPYREKFKKSASIGINLSYLYIHSPYMVFQDRPLYSNNREELCGLDSHIFVAKRARVRNFNEFDDFEPNNLEPGKLLSQSYAQGLKSGTNTLYPAINLAYVMGAAEIALVGVEFRDAKHFWNDPKYGDNPHVVNHAHYWANRRSFPGTSMVLPMLDQMAKYLKSRGVKVWNTAPESAVTSWDKINIGELLAKRGR